MLSLGSVKLIHDGQVLFRQRRYCHYGCSARVWGERSTWSVNIAHIQFNINIYKGLCHLLDVIDGPFRN